MNFKADIENRIQLDFAYRSSEVFEILQSAIQKNDFLKTERVIRCIIFLSEKSIEKLKKNIEAAVWDTRDVMLWAEYTNQEEFGYAKRIRDFNKSFEDAEINVPEM